VFVALGGAVNLVGVDLVEIAQCVGGTVLSLLVICDVNGTQEVTAVGTELDCW